MSYSFNESCINLINVMSVVIHWNFSFYFVFIL